MLVEKTTGVKLGGPFAWVADPILALDLEAYVRPVVLRQAFLCHRRSGPNAIRRFATPALDPIFLLVKGGRIEPQIPLEAATNQQISAFLLVEGERIGP